MSICRSIISSHASDTREVEMFRERAELSKRVLECTDPVEQQVLRKKLSELEQAIALRLEALRINPKL